MAYWGLNTQTAVTQAGMGFGASGGSPAHVYLGFGGVVAGDPIRFFVSDPVASQGINTTTGYTVGKWHHACGVSAAVNDRRVYIDGGSKGTGAANLATAWTMDLLAVGARYVSTAYSMYFDGAIADAAIWNVALTDAEVFRLSRGVSPLLIRRKSLVFYAPLLSGGAAVERDTVGKFHLSHSGAPTWVGHPPLKYPRLIRAERHYPRGAAGGTAALTGTATASMTENDVVAGGKVITITLTGDTWVP